MINVSDVYAVLCTYESAKGYTGEDLFPCCKQGLDWVIAPGGSSEPRAYAPPAQETLREQRTKLPLLSVARGLSSRKGMPSSASKCRRSPPDTDHTQSELPLFTASSFWPC